jgi:hypothetical protein
MVVIHAFSDQHEQNVHRHAEAEGEPELLRQRGRLADLGQFDESDSGQDEDAREFDVREKVQATLGRGRSP